MEQAFLTPTKTSLGQHRCRVSNKALASDCPEIDRVKRVCAVQIDQLEMLRTDTDTVKFDRFSAEATREYQRLISMAQTDIENACTQWVKALTINKEYPVVEPATDETISTT